MVARTLALGAAGAVLAWWLALPAAILIGPAVAVSLQAIRGCQVAVPDGLRHLSFVILGLGIGSGFSRQAVGAILHWPLAFLVLVPMLVLILWLGRWMLARHFSFERTAAALAAAPGHLSFVMGLAHEHGVDTGRIAVVQTIRVMALTLSVPFLALALGVQIPATLLRGGVVADWPVLALLLVAGGVAGLLAQRLSLPAPMLLGPLILSAAGHASGVAPGNLPVWLTVPAFVVLGSLVGTRFAGLSWGMFRSALAAGLAMTVLSVAIAVLAAWPLAALLGMPLVHVVAAFAPGGLETMVALGVAVGANPGFVASVHMVRLLVLAGLIPLFARRARG